MSDSAPTLSQPNLATTGLQGYDLLGGSSGRARSRVRAGTTVSRFRRTRRSWTAAMQKGQVTMSNLPQMFETLQKSVVAITASDSVDQAALIGQTFTEFREAIEPELEKAVGEAAGAVLDKHVAENPEAFEEPLYKGLGTVGRVANLVSMMANQIKRIDEGKEYNSDTDVDPATDDVMALLEHALAAAELALRAAVNEHVDLVGDDEEADEGMNYVTVPNAEAPDDENAALILKTALPEDLAKFASDPGSLAMAAIELGGGLLLHAGVLQETLGKLFEPEGSQLAKFGPPADPSADPNTDPSADPTADAGGDPNDLEAQVEIMGRIMAAGLMQVDHIMQLMGAGGDAGADASVDPSADPAAVGDDGTDPGQAAAPAETAPAEEDPKKKKVAVAIAKSSETEDLRKVVADLEAKLGAPPAPDPELMALRKSVGQLQGQLAKLSQTPATPKAMLAGAQPLTKAADSVMGGDPLDEVLEKLAADLDGARSESQRNEMLLKATFKLPGVDLSAFRKTA